MNTFKLSFIINSLCLPNFISRKAKKKYQCTFKRLKVENLCLNNLDH